LLAGAIKAKGISVSILDANAERLTNSEVSQRINIVNPRLVIFSCYGQNPNASTPFFGAGLNHAIELRKNNFKGLISFVGPHVAALPKDVLKKHDCIDLVFCNEGIFQIFDLVNNAYNLQNIKGIAYQSKSFQILNPPSTVPTQNELENIYKGYAWDLLPYKNAPLDLYRSHLWHSDFGNSPRSPFAAIYTSLGCAFKCSFCMINMINRDSNEVEPIASNFNKMRFFSHKWLKKEFDYLKSMNVKTLRISDEMFYLNRNHYKPILDLLTTENYNFNMWAYSRVDTIKTEYLSEFKNAGINWLCLGIEAGDDSVRLDAFKGKFNTEKVKNSVKKVQDAGIKVLANFIVGLPNDSAETINKTFKLAIDLDAEYSNFYPCMALPGTELYLNAVKSDSPLPSTYDGYGFLSYECVPNPTNTMTPAQVLLARDSGVVNYLNNSKFHSSFEKRFGKNAKKILEDLSKIKLERKLLN
jgi:radical SAM superfamily enzyme YgiQ (UPF0313 family)